MVYSCDTVCIDTSLACNLHPTNTHEHTRTHFYISSHTNTHAHTLNGVIDIGASLPPPHNPKRFYPSYHSITRIIEQGYCATGFDFQKHKTVLRQFQSYYLHRSFGAHISWLKLYTNIIWFYVHFINPKRYKCNLAVQYITLENFSFSFTQNSQTCNDDA